MIHELRLFFVAVQFLTRIPAPRWVGFEPDWLNQSARHFPAVGACVGAVAALVLWAASAAFPPAVAVGLSMAATLLLTGGFHEDGLADTCDALGGAVSRERALEIMKDSRIGSYGALALLVVLGLKAAALTAMPLALAVPALLLGHTASRASAVALAWVALVCAVLIWLTPSWGPLVATGLVPLCAGTLCSALWLRRRLSGYTGDALGATQQVTELLVLLGWLAAARWA